MTDEDYTRWQEHNRQVVRLGGTLTTYIMSDGTIEEYRELNGQRVRNEPERRTELILR